MSVAKLRDFIASAAKDKNVNVGGLQTLFKLLKARRRTGDELRAVKLFLTNARDAGAIAGVVTSPMRVAGLLGKHAVDGFMSTACAVEAGNQGLVWIDGVRIPSIEELETQNAPKVAVTAGPLAGTETWAVHHQMLSTGTAFAIYPPSGYKLFVQGERRIFIGSTT